MVLKELITRGGKKLWVEREVGVKEVEGEKLVRKMSINDPRYPDNLNEIRGGPATIVKGDGFRMDLSKRESRGMNFWHRNLDEDELILVVKGAAKWHTELGTFQLSEGDILIIPRGIAHRVEPDFSKGKYVAIEIKSPSIELVEEG